MKSLLKVPGALAYLLVIFLNAFVDLGHKITIQNTIFKVFDGQTQVVLTAIVNALILLPFILLFSFAGYTSDRFHKHKVMQITSWLGVGLTLAITACYYLGLFWPAFAMTLLLAIQSAVYSPAKYGYIKLLFGKDHLAEGNGLVQTVTIISILLGTFAFSIAFESWYLPSESPEEVLTTIAPIGWLLVAVSLIQALLSSRLPERDSLSHDTPFSLAACFSTATALSTVKPLLSNRVIRLSVVGLAIFWSVGQVMLAAFPAFAKETLAIDNTIVIQGILAASGLGIATGSWLAARWSRGHIETGLIPVGALGVALGLSLLTTLTTTQTQALAFFFIGTMGGLFIVPLNALIQFHARNEELGRILAGNNLFQNISMLLFLVLTAVFALAQLSSGSLLNLIALVAVIGVVYTVYQLPQSLLRLLFEIAMRQRYRVQIQGLNNLPSRGGVLLLGNHISWIDWAIVQIASPRPVRFVMIRSIYQKWYLKWFFDLFGTIPIEPGISSRKSLSLIAEKLNGGEVVCLFPEGAISRTGHLGSFKQGFQRACEECNDDVVIVPFYLRGLWGSRFSRSSEQLRRESRSGRYRDLIVAFGESLPRTSSADSVKRRVFELSIRSWELYVTNLPTIAQHWLKTCKRQGGRRAISDTMTGNMSARMLLAVTIAFARRLRPTCRDEKNVALLLPTSLPGVIANMAALLLGKTLVNLNYTASPEALRAALQQANIKTVISSRKFVDKLENKGFAVAPLFTELKVVRMEDLHKETSKASILGWWLAALLLPCRLLQAVVCERQDADNPAYILFSSGSEGAPKGVMLTHRNLLANIKQTSDVLNVEQQDVIMACLPLFHAFGLTITVLLPLVQGIPMVCHADPTDSLNIGKAIARHRVTILCGTSTFLNLYVKNRKVVPLMLESLRAVVAGAEKLNPSVRQAFTLKFSKHILEGYGATETSPVASVNLPDQLDTDYWKVQLGGKPGTVGMPLPGTSFKVCDPETLSELPTGEDGMILIGGSQVMKGYLQAPEKTASVIRDIDGLRWYITGDKGHLDEDGFLTIVDRYSRFAKLGGEMVSLGAVESQIEKLFPDSDKEFLAVALPDAKKGERVILLTTAEVTLEELKQQLLAAGHSPLTIPAEVLQVEEIPKLGTGKRDFGSAKSLAAELTATTSS